MATHLYYAQIMGVSPSKSFEETKERAYFDGTFTSDSVDAEDRVVHSSNFESMVGQFTSGVRVLDSHKHETNGIGKTVSAKVNGSQIDGSLYVLKGMEVDGNWQPMRLHDQSYPSTTEWLIGLKDGMIDKLSMGWHADKNVCNLCGNSIYSYRCGHYPGESYPITDPETGVDSVEKCTYSCYGVTVVEVSFVYFGANSDARLVAKAKMLASNGSFNPDQIDRIESKLEVAILDDKKRRVFDMALTAEQKQEIQGIVTASVKESVADVVKSVVKDEIKDVAPAAPAVAAPTAAPQGNQFNLVDANGQVVGSINKEDLPAPRVPATVNDVETAVTKIVTPLAEKVDALEKGLSSGETPADRKKAETANLKEFRRVYGKDGDEETQKTFVEALPDIAAIQDNTKGWKQLADAKFGAGRSSDEGVLGILETDDDDDDLEGQSANPM